MKPLATRAIRLLGGALAPVLPLSARKKAAIVLGRHKAPGQFYFSTSLLSDFALADPNAYHRFLWSNHLAYACDYEIGNYFGAVEPSRIHLLNEIVAYLRRRGIDPAKDVQSVLEVGCSVGHVLRYAETAVFPGANVLLGVDIDAHAIESGNAHLESMQSRAKLLQADMVDLDRICAGRRFDVILSCGVLMYVDEATASAVVASMLAHTRLVLGITSLADPIVNNSELLHSGVRPSDGAFIHNTGRMVRACGGALTSDSWQRPHTPDESAPFTILATPL